MASFAASSSSLLRSAMRSRSAHVALGLASTIGGPSLALCEGDGLLDKIMKKDRKGNFDMNASVDALAKELGGQISSAVETGIPTQLSYGFVSGYCSGLALKKAGRLAAVVLGVVFAGLQGLSYTGYITVDHDKLKKDVEGLMDLNDDGKVDQEDVKQGANKILEVLQFNMPSGAGFAAGFVGGLRSG